MPASLDLPRPVKAGGASNILEIELNDFRRGVGLCIYRPSDGLVFAARWAGRGLRWEIRGPRQSGHRAWLLQGASAGESCWPMPRRIDGSLTQHGCQRYARHCCSVIAGGWTTRHRAGRCRR